MTASSAWIDVCDAHADEADGWVGITPLQKIVAGNAAHAIAADVLFLPSGDADNGPDRNDGDPS